VQKKRGDREGKGRDNAKYNEKWEMNKYKDMEA
jgi:hypothetical protein